ncbi:superinfection immunity protein [Asticcacaulis solisilvae]|uniref:superinfection immunity protein n=1 Tax=Asticcacaulis solisilvae TaxID=1217274 RepID=UPI003FD7423D
MGGFSIFHLLFISPILLAMYFVPSIVALARRHRSTGLVIVLNLLLGWSGIGWIGTLIWAIVGQTKSARQYNG